MLFFSDTHLGLDWPSRPKVERPRHGDALYANAERAVMRALAGDIDLVVHGGDVFHRPTVPLWVAERGYSLLKRVACVLDISRSLYLENLPIFDCFSKAF